MAVINNLAFSLGPGMMLVAFLFIGDNWQMGQLRVILGIGMAVLNPLACLSLDRAGLISSFLGFRSRICFRGTLRREPWTEKIKKES